MKNAPELYHGRWFLEVFIHDPAGRLELFSGLTAHEVSTKANTRIEELLR